MCCRRKPAVTRKGERAGINAYESYEDRFSKDNLNAVLVYTENNRHAEITDLAAEKGLHVMVEKPMAATFKQAERMMKASKKHGIKIMANYPTA